MTFWQRLIDALKAIWDTDGPAFPPPVPPPPPPPVVRAITKDDDFRTLPPISNERMCEILADFPMAGECAAIHAATGGNPLPVAQSWLESNYGKNVNARRTNNPLGLLYDAQWAPGPYFSVGANRYIVPLLTFSTWADAFTEWRRRMDDPSYKGSVYPPRMTLGKFVRVYVAGPGPGYANGESAESVEWYLNETVNRINRYLGVATPTPPPPPPGAITFGRVPKPANYEERFIAPGVNTAYRHVNQRIPRGFVLHRMIGTLTGTDHYFRNEARSSALTDLGVGRGRVFRWTDPTARIAPYASGASDPAHAVPSGDGVKFVEAYGWRQNPDCESIEIEGLEYDDPVPAEDYTRIVELLAWRADAWTKIPWNVWPKNNDGNHALFWHNEFQNEKDCPGSVVMELTTQLINDVGARLKHYQEGGA
jgi:hypothetical protein